MARQALTTTAAEHLSQGVEGSAEFVHNVARWSETLDATSLTGLLPVAVTMLILHEMYFSTSENRAPRIGWMLMRIIGFGACLVGYDRVVGMLTGLAGGGAWPDPGNLIAPLDYAITSKLSQLEHVSMANFGEVGLEFLIWAIMFAIDCMMAMLAFIVVTVIVKGQALALIIFIAAGKTCLILSIMPGVGLAKSWAKVVATVAAWSAMAGIVFSAVGISDARLANFAASTSIEAHMQIWLTYGLLALFTAMIPKLVSSLVSGGMAAAPGIGMAVGGAIMGAKMMSPGGPDIRGRAQRVNEGTGTAMGAGATRVARVGGKVARSGGAAAGEAAATAARAAGSAAAKVSDNAVGTPVRSAAMSVALRSGHVGGGAALSKAPLSSPIPRIAETPGAVARAGKTQGDWDVPAREKSSEQWKDEGWSPIGSPAVRPKAKPGHTAHRLKTGWDADGNDQYARWVQVPNKVHGPVAPKHRSSAAGENRGEASMLRAKGLSQDALSRAPQPALVGEAPPSTQTVAHIRREAASSVSVGSPEPTPSRRDLSRALDSANEEHRQRSQWQGGSWVDDAPTDGGSPSPPSRPRRGGKQER